MQGTIQIALENAIKTKIYLSINQNPNAVRPQNGCASSETSVKAPKNPAHKLHSLHDIKANRTLIPESNIQGRSISPLVSCILLKWEPTNEDHTSVFTFFFFFLNCNQLKTRFVKKYIILQRYWRSKRLSCERNEAPRENPANKSKLMNK